jgi:hypothetical protein
VTTSDSGFSTYTSFPALHASIIMSACQWSGVSMATASRSFRASSFSYELKSNGLVPIFLAAKLR